MNSKTLTLAAALIGMLVCVNAYAGDMAFDAKGNLFVLKDKSIVKYAPDGTKTIFANLLSPFFLAVDKSGDLFVGDGADSDSLFRFGPDGKKTFVASLSGLIDPTTEICDSAGNLFIGDGLESSVFKFTPNRSKSTVATNVNQQLMAIDPSDNLFVMTEDGHTLLKVTPDGVKSTAASGFESPGGMAGDRAGNVFVEADPGTVYKVRPDGSKSMFATGLGIQSPILICDKSDNLFVADRSGVILEFSPDGTKKSTFTSDGVSEMAVEETGNLFVKSESAIFEFKSDGSRRTLISDRFSPDKQWEYWSTAALGIVKVGTDQVVLDLSDAPSLCRVLGATVAWAPDSKRLAFNYSGAIDFRYTTTAIYQLRDGKWVMLDLPIDRESERTQLAQLADGKLPKNRSQVSEDVLKVIKWADPNTALLYASEGKGRRFLVTLAFDSDGRSRIVKSRPLSDKDSKLEFGN
jgi:hypothetical protein